MPIVDELKGIRRTSFARGTAASQRRMSITLDEQQKRRMSMGYEKFLIPGLASPPFGSKTSLSSKPVGTGDNCDDSKNVEGKYFGDNGELKFRSDLHAVMYKYTESKFFTGFIMFIILVNTTMLVAQTWPLVLVRTGKMSDICMAKPECHLAKSKSFRPSEYISDLVKTYHFYICIKHYLLM